MEDYQTRVVEEKEALDTKIAALQKFTTEGSLAYRNAIKTEKSDMATQLSAMTIYSQALGRRIERFPAPEAAAPVEGAENTGVETKTEE